MKRFLIIRTDKIGDVILTLPVITNIRLAFPDSFIAFLGREYTKKVLVDNPNLNEILIYDRKNEHKGFKGILKLRNLIKKYNFDACVVVFPTFRVALALLLAGVPIRIGIGYRWYSFLFNKRVFFHRSRVEKHELEYNLDLLKPLNIEIKDKSIKVWLNDSVRRFADNFFKENKINTERKIIGIHPGGAESVVNWRYENFAGLIESIKKEINTEIIIIEGRNEERITNEVIKNLSFKPVILKGDADIKQVAAIISRMNLFISGNTGTMHIAAAESIPTLSLFSPVFTVGSKRFSPWGNKSVIVQPEGFNCKFCNYKKCDKYNCMDSISVENVMEKVRLFC